MQHMYKTEIANVVRWILDSSWAIICSYRLLWHIYVQVFYFEQTCMIHFNKVSIELMMSEHDSHTKIWNKLNKWSKTIVWNLDISHFMSCYIKILSSWMSKTYPKQCNTDVIGHWYVDSNHHTLIMPGKHIEY